MTERAKRIIAIAVLLVSGGAFMPTTVASELDSFRPCGSDEVLYNPSTDDIALLYRPVGKFIVFPSVGQARYVGRSRSPEYTQIVGVDPYWRNDAANKAKELRATGKCKANVGG